jgi:hypothetical protein
MELKKCPLFKYTFTNNAANATLVSTFFAAESYSLEQRHSEILVFHI